MLSRKELRSLIREKLGGYALDSSSLTSKVFNRVLMARAYKALRRTMCAVGEKRERNGDSSDGDSSQSDEDKSDESESDSDDDFSLSPMQLYRTLAEVEYSPFPSTTIAKTRLPRSRNPIDSPRCSLWYQRYLDPSQARRSEYADEKSKRGKLFRRRFRLPMVMFYSILKDLKRATKPIVESERKEAPKPLFNNSVPLELLLLGALRMMGMFFSNVVRVLCILLIL